MPARPPLLNVFYRGEKAINEVDIEQESYGNYVIRCRDDQNKVWTYNENTKEIELKDYTRGNNNQTWKFEQIIYSARGYKNNMRYHPLWKLMIVTGTITRHGKWDSVFG